MEYYPFLSKDDNQNSYGFETINGILYDVKFRPSAYILGDETTEYSNHLYEFIIEMVLNPLHRKPPLDLLVSKTIAAIIKDFYYKKNESVCIYICDSSDGRQDLRRRKFDDWFYNHPEIGLTKIDEQIEDSKGIYYPISLIIKKTNPYYIEIIVAFANITSRYSK